MRAVRSLLFNLLFFSWTAVILLICVPALPFGVAAVHRVGRLWVRVTLWLLALVVGLTHRIVGLENLPAGPAIVAPKHQSTWDTLIFALPLNLPAYVLKRELMRIPLFGLYLRCAGMIPVDRSGGGSALKRMVASAKQAAAAGRHLLIYPEGTRTAPGERRPYHPGVAALYSQLDLPVVPVALNSGLFWGRRAFLKRPGVITVAFLPAIPPGLPRRQFIAELQSRIETASDLLVRDGGGSAGA
jgi:1-acyl-sn-glycerol-3-phosphate acyltransferase